MVIGIDASRSSDLFTKTGVEVVSDAVIKHIIALESEFPNARFVYYMPREISWIPQQEQRIISMRRLWTQIGLSLRMLIDRPDVLFIPVHRLPFFCPKRTYRIIHDVAFLRKPEAYSWFGRLLLRIDLTRSVRICKKIFVPTQAVKDDLLHFTAIDPDRVIVIRFGYTGKQRNRETGKQRNRKKQILFIGRVEEKKNIGNLVDAFELFAQQHPDYQLVLAGKPGHGYDNIRLKIEDLRLKIGVEKIIELGYVSEEEKFQLISESMCLALVSKEEGFGFPVLEGFDCGTPVIASRIDVLQDIGGTACLFVDPNKVSDIAHGLKRIVSDDVLRVKLQREGNERLKTFSWEKFAKIVLDELVA